MSPGTVVERHIIIVGNGTIGSHLAVMLVRSGGVRRITLIDPDKVERRNLVSQNFSSGDEGHFKVEVVAEQLRSLDSSITVETITEAIQCVPLTVLWGADLIASCLDSLEPRIWVSQQAWRCGIPMVDAGVRAEGNLVRLDLYEPSPEFACLECGLSGEERAIQESRYPCQQLTTEVASRSPAYLGMIAAGLQCHAALRILSGDQSCVHSGHQQLLDLSSGRSIVSTRRRSPDCPFDHRGWSIQSLDYPPDKVSLQRALQLAASKDARLRVDGDAFVRRLLCPTCHTERETLFLAARLGPDDRICPQCGDAMVVPGISISDSLSMDQLTSAERTFSLQALGLRPGDVFTLETATSADHFELGGGV